jgi:hypothetical protein
MARRGAFLRSVAMLAAVFVVASCDHTADRESPLAPVTPAAPQAGVVGDLLSDILRPPPPGPFTLITETPHSGPFQLTRLLNISGGTISVAGITVDVPAGAVTVPTLFTVFALPTPVIDASLTAVIPQWLGRVLDIGERGFNKPVTITMSYAQATNVVDPSKLVIVYYNYDENRLEALPSTVDTVRKTVSARTRHFSKYGMASN